MTIALREMNRFRAAISSIRQRLPGKMQGGLVIIGVYALVALLAPLIAPDNPDTLEATPLQGSSSMHLLGTDPLGRDELSRLIYATRIDLPIAVIVVILAALIGVTLGSIAAYRGGFADSIITAIANLVQAFPIYVLLLALVFALGAGERSIVAAYVAIDWVVYARLSRGEVLRIKNLEYVQSARAAGISDWRILGVHIIPNALKQIYVYMSSDVVLAITTVATFSYFGLGVQDPTAEWGSMVAAGQQYLTTNPLLALLPGAVMIVLGIGFALLGDGLDDLLGL